MYKFQHAENTLKKCREVLNKSDGIIAFPTDTVWGIGCLIENKQAVEKIYSIKSRDENKPLILLGSKIDYLVPYVTEINKTTTLIIEKYLPGALTIVLKKSLNTPDYITSGMDTVGIRIPNYPPLVELLDKAVDSHVLATTSANISGMGSSISRQEVKSSLKDQVDYIMNDFGFKPSGAESTVISIDSSETIKILRQGSLRIEI